ncbi:MAG: hypothetical protein SFX73_31870 [Kofleriaceae bacterium]|nr:hypothetical protein [Kofleriaceae bacterium]
MNAGARHGGGAAMDPARRTIVAAIDEATKRADSASRAIVRYAYGLPWSSDRIRAERAKLERALVDVAVARSALAELNALDGIAESP